MKLSVSGIVKDLENDNFSQLHIKKISEKNLMLIAMKLKSAEEKSVKCLINYYISENNIDENCDWNIGSILQHFDSKIIIEYINSISVNKRAFLYDSIGITWALGDSESRDEKIVEYLYEVLNFSRNPEAWWRSAFAIEKLTGKNAINNLKRSLKNQCKYTLTECFDDLGNKKKIIGLLFYANNLEIKDKIYPELKKQFYIAYEKNDNKLLLNIIWLFGRLRLYDNEVYEKILEILEKTNDYEIIYYIFQSVSDDPKELFHKLFLDSIHSEDPLVRKMALRGLSNLGLNIDIEILHQLLEQEQNESVIGEITKTIYNISNENIKKNKNIFNKYIVNENGLICDDSDKWYADASIYNIFSECEDVENICFNLIKSRIIKEGIDVRNPVDLACGTGRTTKNILNNLNYSGTLYSVDLSPQMLNFLQKTIDREKYYVNSIELVNSTIEEFELKDNQKSSFIISSFGFPSKISSRERCIKELKSVYENLADDGVFVTIGWDETFNDELNEMWYRYIPDDIIAYNFENWRMVRSNSISTARNCGLTWYKKNLQIPLLFNSLEETVNVMGHLFGKDAALHILKEEKRTWWMAMGITWDTKDNLKRILERIGEE